MGKSAMPDNPRRDDAGLSRRDVLKAGAQASAALLIARRTSGQEANLVAAIGTPEPGAVPFVEPEVRRSVKGLLDTSLTVRFADNELAGRTVRTRTFDGRLTGPTLRFRPGDVVRVRYVNALPPEEDDHHAMVNAPHAYNVTNLHTHGLWVSPAGNSDNVLYSLYPGHEFQHEYLVPREHVSGTFWYHPHRHGSVALQVEGGMSGAIIIEGGIDELPEIAAARERLFVLQQINDQEVAERRARETSLVGIAGINEKVTSVNGQHVPTLSMRPGEVQRWRIVAANSHDVLPLSMRAPVGARLRPPTLHQISGDGIPLRRVLEKEEVVLSPGNRADVLVRAGDPGLYRFHKRGFPQMPFVDVPDDETVAWVRVEGEPLEMPVPDLLPARYSHPAIEDDEITGPERRLVFSVAQNPTRFLINGKEFEEDVVDVAVRLGAVEQWRLENSSEAGHPFHIHVNPFQVMASSDPTLEVGAWKDTVLIPAPTTPGGANGFVVIRSRFERYIGRFVLHCHILGHEDRGMMMLVEIAT